MADPVPFLSVVIPTLDEERFIGPCIHSLLDDPYPRDRLEILVVDGRSTDATRAEVEAMRAEIPQLRLIDNPARLQSAAFNLAMVEADPRATVLLRCDAHALYTPGFMTRAVDTLEKSGAVLVAFTDRPIAEGAFQTAVAFSQSTPLGVGAARYRLGGFSGWVDHGKHGCFSRAAVTAVGGYDESFSHNEDGELSLRLREAGGKIWLDADLVVGYSPRATPRSLARQYYLYGRGRALTCLKHRIVPSPRQMLPPLLVLWHGALLLGARRRPRLLAPIAVYLATLTGFGAWAAARRRDPRLLLSPAVLAIMHHAWGGGFLTRVGGRLVGLSKILRRRRARAA
ncbi:MAG: glycosyltransferase family 2 protein [Solirubrobacterales bacterium]